MRIHAGVADGGGGGARSAGPRAVMVRWGWAAEVAPLCRACMPLPAIAALAASTDAKRIAERIGFSLFVTFQTLITQLRFLG